MSPEPTYWLIETQSQGVQRFYGSADESALQQACRYASTAPQPMLHIQERELETSQRIRPFAASTG
jgi:hypothetical protein